MMQVDTVLHGDALTELRKLPDNSVDSIVTDPPAGISFMGKEWDNFSGKEKTYDSKSAKDASYDAYGKGALPYGFSSSSGQPTRKERDTFIAFLREVMTEALRVLKPGGHALVWALPRTSHWTATALEDAGFEVRDAVFHHFGSGFPKSTAIDKQIDKMLGKEREVIGTKTHPWKGLGNDVLGKDNRSEDDRGYVTSQITKPATPEAAQWAGYGTALKPSTEIWWLVRKPLAESSIAANVLAWGTGGLNISATRIRTGDDLSRPLTPAKGWKNTSELNGSVNDEWKKGRWPSHLLLSHSIWCIPQGVKRVRANGPSPNGTPRQSDDIVNFGMKLNGTISYREEDGYEQVEAYQCHESCPIRELDLQSGVRKSGARVNKAGAPFAWGSTHARDTAYEASEGGASRYFTNFPPDDYIPFGYFSKASRAERSRGLPTRIDNALIPECEDGFATVEPVDFLGTGIGGNGQAYKTTPVANSHPTVKSLALMRWLIRLITPPGGVVLDMFGGSGSTACAAIQENCHFILIEQDASYVQICEARIAHAMTHEPQTVQVARKKVKGTAPSGRPTIGQPIEPGASWSLPMRASGGHYADQDGMEEVEDWDCAEDCPIRIIGEQSGERHPHRSPDGNTTSHHKGGQGNAYGMQYERASTNYTDTGTAARYFQQFPPDSLFADQDEVAI